MLSVDNKTIQDFGVQWMHFGDNYGYYGSLEYLQDILGPLMSVEDIKNSHVMDIGSGTGRIVNMVLDAGAEHVVAVKWDVPQEAEYDDMCRFAHIFHVIDNSLQPARCYRNGGRGYISLTAPIHPPHDLRIWELLEGGRHDEARAMHDRVCEPLRQFCEKSRQRSGGYRVIKGMMEVMGHPVGPPRPPTLPLDAQEMAELQDLLGSFGWPVPVRERVP